MGEKPPLGGAPGTGIHSIRFAGLAFVDLFATVLAALLAGKLLKQPFWLCFLVLMLVGIATHEAMGVNTRLNAAIFRRPYKVGK